MATKNRYKFEKHFTFAEDARVFADSYKVNSHDAENHILSLGTPLANCCVFCGTEVDRDPRDHIFASSKGGPTVPGNMMRTCTDCNSSRGNVSALDRWRASDPAKRWFRTEKDFIEALERLTAPFREDYPKEYARAVAIQAGDKKATLDFYGDVARHRLTAPHYSKINDEETLKRLEESFVEHYLSAESARNSPENAHAYDKLSTRSDSFAKIALEVANTSGGNKDTQRAWRSNVARSALKFEQAVNMKDKKSEQKEALRALLSDYSERSSSFVRPYRKLFEAHGSGYKHLLKVAVSVERELSRENNRQKTMVRNEARVTVQNLFDGKLQKPTARDLEMLDHALGHPATGKLAIFRRLIAEVHAGTVELPAGYAPNAKAQAAINRGY